MKFALLLMLLLFNTAIHAQPDLSEKVYILEGIVAEADSGEPLAAVVLSGINKDFVTTTDEDGYFKLALTKKQVKENALIHFSIFKQDYKSFQSAITYNPAPNSDTSVITWQYDLKVIWLAKERSHLSSTVTAYAPREAGSHGRIAAKNLFNEEIQSRTGNTGTMEGKMMNEKIYFPMDNFSVFSTTDYDITIEAKIDFVYVDGKKTQPEKLNTQYKKSAFWFDQKKSQQLSEAEGTEIFAFTSSKPANEVPPEN